MGLKKSSLSLGPEGGTAELCRERVGTSACYSLTDEIMSKGKDIEHVSCVLRHDLPTQVSDL